MFLKVREAHHAVLERFSHSLSDVLFCSSEFSEIKRGQYHKNIQLMIWEVQVISVLRWHINCVPVHTSTPKSTKMRKWV